MDLEPVARRSLAPPFETSTTPTKFDGLTHSATLLSRQPASAALPSRGDSPACVFLVFQSARIDWFDPCAVRVGGREASPGRPGRAPLGLELELT